MGLELQYGEHPPLLMGMYPLTIGVRVICVVHAIICILVVSLASSVVTADIAGYAISPDLQVGVASWHLLGVSLNAAALYATFDSERRQALPLRAYFWYLVAATLTWCAAMVRVFQQGSSCSFVKESHFSQRVGLSFSCGLVSAAWELCAVAVLVAAIYACWTVYHLQEDIVSREGSQHLLDHEPLHVKQLRRAHEPPPAALSGHLVDLPPLAEDTLWAGPPAAAWVAPRLGAQPAWGAVHIRAASTAT